MLRAALRDLQWRRKRFVIAMAGVALVFAMGLVMTGLAASFSMEVDRTLDAIGADTWAVAQEAWARSTPSTRSCRTPPETRAHRSWCLGRQSTTTGRPATSSSWGWNQLGWARPSVSGSRAAGSWRSGRRQGSAVDVGRRAAVVRWSHLHCRRHGVGPAAVRRNPHGVHPARRCAGHRGSGSAARHGLPVRRAAGRDATRAEVDDEWRGQVGRAAAAEDRR